MKAHAFGRLVSRAAAIAAAVVVGAVQLGGPQSARGDDSSQTKPPLTAIPFYTTNFTGTVAVQTAVGHNNAALIDPMVTVFNMAGGPLYPAGFYNPASFRYWHPQWTRQWLGTVFGLTLDARGNIYVGHTLIYTGVGYSNIGTLPNPWFRPNTTGTITRLNGFNGAPFKFQNIPQFGTGSGAGNICYNVEHNCFYVTSLHDGRIYRLNGTTGTIMSNYNPFSNTLMMGGVADPMAVTPFSPVAKRVWAVERLRDRVYFSVWSQDGSNTGGAANTIRSVRIGPAGDFIPGTGQLEVTMPVYPGRLWSHPVSDIAFSPDCRMLLGERSMSGPLNTGAHDARVLEYAKVAGVWTLTTANTLVPITLGMPVGNFGQQTNSAGGVDYDYRVRTPIANSRGIWATADAQLLATGQAVYGFMGMDRVGATSATSTNCDYDGLLTTANKRHEGDVSISAPIRCATITNELISCVVDGSVFVGYSYTATITNNSLSTINTVSVAIIGGPGTVTPGTFSPGVIPPGGSFNVNLLITGVPSGGPVCLSIQLGVQQEVLCRTTRCLTLPACDCGQVIRLIPFCLGTQPRASLMVQNLTSSMLFNVTLIPLSTGVTFTPATFAVGAVPPGGNTPPMQFNINGAAPGQQVCFTVKYLLSNQQTCTFIACLIVPNCNIIVHCPTCPVPDLAILSNAVRLSSPTGVQWGTATSVLMFNPDGRPKFGTSQIILTASDSTGSSTPQITTTDLVMQPWEARVVDLPPATADPTLPGINMDCAVNLSLSNIGQSDSDLDLAQGALRLPKTSGIPQSASIAQGTGLPPQLQIAGGPRGEMTIVLNGPPNTTTQFTLTASDGMRLRTPGTIIPGETITLTLEFGVDGRSVCSAGFVGEQSERLYHIVIVGDVDGDGTAEYVGTVGVFIPPVGCLADVADDSLDTDRNPNGQIGPEDLDAFISGFIAENVAIADVASDSLDIYFNPNGTVGAEDLDAFIASFIRGGC